jgi:hypothetical protein
MAAITWEMVVAAAKELTSTDTFIQEVALSIANGSGIDASNFGGEDAEKTRLARIAMCAHVATLMTRRRGAAGILASQSVGGMSRSYALGFTNPRTFDLTSYGNALRVLAVGTPARAGVVV